MAKLRGLCSKLSILSCCVILLFSNAYAQKENNEQRKKNINKNNVQIDPTLISSEKVPANVIKTFNKRFSSATEAQWHNNGEKDTFYIVNYIMREVQMESLFGKSGYWISTTEPVDPDNLLSACHKTIAMFFSKYKIVAAYKISRSDKNNQFLVHIIESQNAKSQSITKIYLDKSGKLINIEEPTEVQENKTEKIDKKTAKEEAKLKKEFEKDKQLDIYPTKISDDELPNGIQYWVNKNYPDYIFKNIEYLIDEDFEEEGNIYRIVIQRNGINQPYATVWFTRDGEFLQLIDEFRDTEIKNEKPAPKRQVGENIKEAFSAKYPNISSVVWEEDDDGNWIGAYTDKYGQNFATFDNNAQWLYTRTLIDYTKAPYAVRSAVENDYPKYEATKTYKVTTPEGKPYYTLELYLKKDKSTISVDFQQNGKPLE